MTSFRYAYFALGANCPANKFSNMNLIFDLTFCGDWVFFFFSFPSFLLSFSPPFLLFILFSLGWSGVWIAMPRKGFMPNLRAKQSQGLRLCLLANQLCEGI
jgi:hypothetical protein